MYVLMKKQVSVGDCLVAEIISKLAKIISFKSSEGRHKGILSERGYVLSINYACLGLRGGPGFGSTEGVLHSVLQRGS